MPKKNLDQKLEQRLYSVTLGRVTLISLEEIHFSKVDGVAVLIDAGARPQLRKLLETKAGVDVAQELGISAKKISRLKKGLGIPLEPREGTSRTTAWRRAKGKKDE